MLMNNVKKYLDSKGWEYEEVDENTIGLGFSVEHEGSSISFPLYFMKIKDINNLPILRLSIVPYIEQPINGYSEDKYKIICQINHDLLFSRFALDSDMDIEFIMDVSGEKVDNELLEKSMDYLTDYALIYYDELSK